MIFLPIRAIQRDIERSMKTTEEEEEMESLVSSASSNLAASSFEPNSSTSGSASSRRGCCRVVGCALLLFMAGMAILTSDDTSGGGATISKTSASSKHHHEVVQFSCPTAAALSKTNFEVEQAFDDYLKNGTQPVYDEHFSQTFRHAHFDGWGRTFEEFKASMRDFKRNYFVPHLQNGDHIYESACGLGLNLYATLEILQEEGNLSDITIYGNEYLQESTEKANQILDLLLGNQNTTEKKNHKGVVCQGDATDLSYIPTNSFDLVFTGYISPLWDPLELSLNHTDNYKHLRDLCRSFKKTGKLHSSKAPDWKSVKLLEIAQLRQNDWFSNWVQQMIRIAKPGAPVIIEEVGTTYCENTYDFGGVQKDFWKTGAKRYGWDIDPSSVAFGSRGGIWKNRRYHVFLRKTNTAK